MDPSVLLPLFAPTISGWAPIKVYFKRWQEIKLVTATLPNLKIWRKYWNDSPPANRIPQHTVFCHVFNLINIKHISYNRFVLFK